MIHPPIGSVWSFNTLHASLEADPANNIPDTQRPLEGVLEACTD